MKLENKILLPFILFFVSVLTIELLFLDFASLTKENYENVINYDSRFESHTNTLIYYGIIREASFQNYLRSGDERFVEEYNRYVKKY